MPDDDARMPQSLAAIAEDFRSATPQERLQLLLEFSEELPQLPSRYADAPEKMEQVHECQSPVFIVVEFDGDVIHLHATAPREAPTTRGFASILAQGLDGLTPEQVLAVPADYPLTLGLSEAVSPLRIRGMVGMLGRVQRQVKLQAAVA